MSDKKSQLIEASIDLFAKEGFWNTPTARIARHAGVATGTLFNYFSSKDALIDAVFLQLKHELAIYLAEGYPAGGEVKTRMFHLCRRYIEWGVHNPVRFSLMEQLRLSNLVSEAAQSQMEENYQFAYELLESGQQQGLLADIPLDYAGSIVLTVVETALKYALAKGFRGDDLSNHIEQSFNIFWKGLTN